MQNASQEVMEVKLRLELNSITCYNKSQAQKPKWALTAFLSTKFLEKYH